MAPKDEHEEDVAEDEGGHGMETFSGDHLCLQRCLPWSKFPLTMAICNRQVREL